MKLLLLIALLGPTKRVSEDATDVCSGSDCTRTIQRDINYRDESNNLHETDNVLEAAVDPGDLPDGALAYGEQSPRAPAQCYLVNDDDADNSTRYVCRKSDNKAAWFRLQAATADPNFQTGVASSVDRANRKVNWVGLWYTGPPDTSPRKANLVYYKTRRGVRAVVRIRGALAPTSYQFRIRLPVDWSFSIGTDGRGLIKNPSSVVRWSFRAPVAWEGEDSGPDPDGVTYAAHYAIDESGTNGGGFPYWKFSLVVDDDLSAATFPVWAE